MMMMIVLVIMVPVSDRTTASLHPPPREIECTELEIVGI
jgi:hypothetical protein